MKIRTVIDGAVASIWLEGKLNVQSSSALKEAMANLPAKVRDLNIDISGLDYIASAGLRVLIAADKHAIMRGGKMRLLHPKQAVADNLEMTGLSDVLDVES